MQLYVRTGARGKVKPEPARSAHTSVGHTGPSLACTAAPSTHYAFISFPGHALSRSNVMTAPVLDGGEYGTGKVPAHDMWRLLLAEPSTPRGNLTIRQRAVLRDLLVGKDDLTKAAANITDPTDKSPCE